MWGRDLISFFCIWIYSYPSTICWKTVDPWMTWVWTALVHFYADFFQWIHNYNAAYKMQGWMNPWMWIRRADCKVLCRFSTVWWVFKGQLHCAFLFKCLTVLVFKIFFLNSLLFHLSIFLSLCQSPCLAFFL